MVTEEKLDRNKFVLITGGSSGIGKELAFELAKLYFNIALVALPGPELKETADYIKKNHNVEVIFLEIDLTEENAANKVLEWCNEEDIQIEILINNAGVGHTGPYEDVSSDIQNKMMQLNMRVLVNLTQVFLPMLKQVERAHILNVSSMAGLYAVPYKTLYSATKSFVNIFSQALRGELKDTPVIVSCLYPGPTVTNQDVQDRIDSSGVGKIATMSAESVAKFTVRKMLMGRSTIVPGGANRSFLFATKLIPKSFLQKMFIKTFKS